MTNNWLRYSNKSKIRNKPLSPELVNKLGNFLPGMGLEMEVFSGGQDGIGEGNRRTGSVRHDHGGAGDAFFYKDGRRLDWANPQDLPIFQDIIKNGRAAGLTGFGAGPGYMQPGSMHIGMGGNSAWGAGGRSKNAPAWLTEAYNAKPGVTLNSAPVPASATPTPSPSPLGTLGAIMGAGPSPVGAPVGPDGPKGREMWPMAKPGPAPLIANNSFPAAPSPLAGMMGSSGGVGGMLGGLGSIATALGGGGGGGQQAPSAPPPPNLQINRGDNASAAGLMASVMEKKRRGIPGMSLMG